MTSHWMSLYLATANPGQPYTWLDAAAILLREGMEALLVLVALLAFLNKSGNGDKRRWLWLGAGIGLLASIATAVVIQAIFSTVFTHANQELLEGITGLIAAGLLFYVSYWLHRRSSVESWQGYLRQQATAALETKGFWALVFLAFLAVYREGSETLLFYLGMATSISTSELLKGVGIGSLLLVVFAWLLLGLGVRIPLRPFFLATSLLIYFLGFKFVGSGLHALQVAGSLPTHPSEFLPSLRRMGLYPNWETTIVQGILLITAGAIFLKSRTTVPTDPTHAENS